MPLHPLKKHTKLTKSIPWFLIYVFLFLSGLELFSTYILKKHFITEERLALNIDPVLEFDNNLLRVRRNPFQANTLEYRISDKIIKKNNYFGALPSKIYFSNSKEGLIRNSLGDTTLNSHGFLGPYFKQKRNKNIFKIFVLGDSTSIGSQSNELAWPRILERMLNNKQNSKFYFQIINGGVWEHNSCDVKELYKREINQIDPDMVLILTGWNDIEKLKSKKNNEEKQYCHKDIRKKFSSYRLFKRYIDVLFPKNEIKKTLKINEINLSGYQRNLTEIIQNALIKNIQVGLISLPTVMETSKPIAELIRYPQLADMVKGKIEYERKAGLKINETQKKLSSMFTNAFHIRHETSFSAKEKDLFFNDRIHLTGEGNRILAYGVYKKINQRVSIHTGISAPNEARQINRDRLEIEYIESIFSSYKLEDFSYVGCVAIHKNCTRQKRNLKHEYITSLVSFSLASIFKFREEVKRPSIKNRLEELLLSAITLRPNFSLSYWVLSILYDESGQKELAQKYKARSLQINPLLKNISFEELRNFYKKREIHNPFLEKIEDLIQTLEKMPNYIGSYHYFRQINIIKKRETKSITNREKSLFLYIIKSLYLTSPLLGQSIFKFSYEYFNSINDHDTANYLLNSYKQIKPQYYF
jgi:lysophospholipase L1-like esterase